MSRKLAVFLGFEALAAAVAVHLGVSRVLDASPGACTPWVLLPASLILFDHHRTWVWRRPSLLLFGGILAGLLAWAMASVVDELLGREGGWSLPGAAACLAAPWPGHLLVLVTRWRRGISVPVRGRRRKRVEDALRRHPAWRLTDGPGDPTGIVHEQGLHDLSAWLQTPDGPVPLQPQGPDRGMGRRVKRLLDVVFVLVLLPLVLPLTLVLALIVRLRGGGPAFYAQERVTEGGRPFRIHKIRSMVSDAEPDGRPVWPEEHDPRITPFGRFLRRYWLDELPQLLDVLRGPLSVVGPRPERPFFVQEFTRDLPNYPLRHQVKSGITGLAQISGYVGNTSIGRRLHLDLRYARRWTPLMDLGILLGTVMSVFRRPPIEARER